MDFVIQRPNVSTHIIDLLFIENHGVLIISLANNERQGKLSTDDIQGVTYTVTNVVSFGSVFWYFYKIY